MRELAEPRAPTQSPNALGFNVSDTDGDGKKKRVTRHASIADLTIIVPWMGDDATFELTLASVLRYRPAGCQVVVPHGPHFVDHYDLAEVVDLVELVELSVPIGLTELFNAGLRCAIGSVVHLLRPGIEVDEGWTDRPMEILSGDSRIASTAPPILDQQQPRRILVCGIQRTGHCKRRVVGGYSATHWRSLNRRVVGPSSWCAFYRRDALEQIRAENGCVGDANFADSTLDLDIALSLRALGFRHQVASDYSVSTERVRIDESKDLSGLDAQRLFRRHQSRDRRGLANWLDLCSEVAQGMISWRRTKFLWGRLKAGRFATQDDRFRSRLNSRTDPTHSSTHTDPVPGDGKASRPAQRAA